MDKASAKKAKEELEAYLSKGVRRKTGERFAVLDAVYSFSGMFTAFDLQQKLEKQNYFISRATVYNCLKLFISLRLVTRHKLEGEASYEPTIGRKNHCEQICTMCGKKKELRLKSLPALRNNVPLERFQAETYNVTVYGICSSCKAMETRRRRTELRRQKKEEKLNELKRLSTSITKTNNKKQQ